MVKSGLIINAVLFFSLFTSACSAVTKPSKRISALEHEQQVNITASLTWPASSYSQECWMKRPVKLAAGAAALLQQTKHRRHGDGDGDGGGDDYDGDGELEGDGDGWGDELEGDGDGDGDDDWDGGGELDGDQPPDWDSPTGGKDGPPTGAPKKDYIKTAAHFVTWGKCKQSKHTLCGTGKCVTGKCEAQCTVLAKAACDKNARCDAVGVSYKPYSQYSYITFDNTTCISQHMYADTHWNLYRKRTPTSPTEADMPTSMKKNGDSTGGGVLPPVGGDPPPPPPPKPTSPPSKPPAKKPSFDTVLKDGFLRVNCVKDYMYEYGDKYGDGKFAYKFGKKSSTSIMRYDVLVAKEDQKQMTPKVCFEFCRTIPDMGFFGLLNGRTCYCTPYFKAMAGDSSMCDAVCPGEPTNMCGGKSKSQVFAMHMCNSAEEDLKVGADSAETAVKKMDKKAKKAKTLSTDMQSGAASLQQSLGAAGDTAATDLMQKAKVFAGELEHQAEDVEAVSAKLITLIADSKTTHVSGSVRGSEKLTATMDKTREQGRDATNKLSDLMDSATKADGELTNMYDGAAKQYYPLMYFVDKDFSEKPSTCGGDAVGKPMADTSLDGCAWACDENVGSCVGFSYYAEEKLCFLMSKFSSAFYYTGCKSNDRSGGTAGPPPGFLQQQVFLQESKGADVTCMAKFSDFEGTTLKPDPSGKCKQCLKTITKADRCYK